LIAAERVAQTVYQGMHGRRRAGVGETFWQFRRYESGDPAERIDWRQSARTDKIFVREREWEAVQTACLWADASGSMRYASHKSLPTKAERAQLLMLALASLCLRGGENVVWLDRQPVTLRGKQALERLALRLEDGAADNTALPDYPLPRHATMILCSDFLLPPEQLREQLRVYAAQKMKGVLLHILDPLEESFTMQGHVDLQGCEDEASLRLPDAAAVKVGYAQKLAEHKARLAHMAQSAGWHYLRHVTSAAPAVPVMQLYTALSVK